MLRQHHRFYYTLKPFLPWRLRNAVRRISVRSRLKTCGATWPINPTAGAQPEGWPGWPDKKRFAVVLTHDVESSAGLAKCTQLLELEQKLGFRSSFNLIPEGEYRAPSELRAAIKSRGFEIGVHDLKHDGKLFRSHAGFQQSAIRINRYLRDWGACGYRSGFMVRNLDWFHELDIQYDSSTFDTDPFELQPNGAGTIFPFWVPLAREKNQTHRGYVELPYTLPQDSTLFLILRESSPDIWLKKVDWIAANGGMVLVNVHPDYIRFEGGPASPQTYPVAHYSRLLEYIRQKYPHEYWQPLPQEVARFTASLPSPPAVRLSRRVCMVTHSFYESDNRVTRYAEALAARGDHVDVLALQRSPDRPKHEVIEGVNVFRLQKRFGKKERSEVSYLWPLIRFLAICTWWITRRNSQNRYDLLHIHNMPDFLVFSGLYPRITGARIILDIHDIVPEFYTSKFSNGNPTTTTSILKLIERYSAKFADHIIVSNHLWLEKYEARTRSQGKCSVFINNVDTRIFQPQERSRRDGRLIVIFPGGLQWHQGLDIALSSKLPHAEFHIYGDGNMKQSLISLAAELGFNGKVKFFEPVGVRQVARIMADADLGVVPKRADSFGNEAYSTKIMEFMSCGVPVVVSKTKIDQYYFNDSVVRFFESGNQDALASAMLDVLQNPDLRRRIIANASAYSEVHSWRRRKSDYLRIVDDLVNLTTNARGHIRAAEVVRPDAQ
jgi:glycosyltransferase involved in cell wall biosynthesis/peptidoglycan/xylan/chitin deacetylase (PgdA/CDA1 family)